MRPFRHGSYANVTATIALVVALSGGAYAATALPKNSVGTPQLKKGAVTAPKIAGNAVTGGAVKNGSLTADDLRPGTIPAEPNFGATARAVSYTLGNSGFCGDVPVALTVAPDETSYLHADLVGKWSGSNSTGSALQGSFSLRVVPLGNRNDPVASVSPAYSNIAANTASFSDGFSASGIALAQGGSDAYALQAGSTYELIVVFSRAGACPAGITATVDYAQLSYQLVGVTP